MSDQHKTTYFIEITHDPCSPMVEGWDELDWSAAYWVFHKAVDELTKHLPNATFEIMEDVQFLELK